MRVIHVVPGIAEQASGPAYSVVRLCESLIACGHEATLAVLDHTPLASPPRFLNTFSFGLGPRRLGRSPAMHRWLSAQAASGEVDVIHNHSLWMMPNVYSGSVARRAKLPLVVSPRGTFSEWAMRSGSAVKRLYWPLVQRPALAAAACFHATATSECHDVRRMGYQQPVAVIPNGIDVPPLKARHHVQARTVLFLGRVHPKKGLDMLLPAWAAVQHQFPDWRLRIVGPDNRGHLATIQRLAAALRLERVEFSGPLYGEEKWQAYWEADLFVLPTYSENFGMSVAEALAAATPAIVSKGAPWAGVERRGAGWWIEIGVDPLVACLEDALARPPDDLHEMGLRGRAWMEAEYSWARIGEMMAETYHWLLNGGRVPAWIDV